MNAAEREKDEEGIFQDGDRNLARRFTPVGVSRHLEGVSIHRSIQKVGYLGKVLWVPARWSAGIPPAGGCRRARSPQFHREANVSFPGALEGHR